MHWRHEQLTLRMVLATVQHHSHGALHGQNTATRTGEWGSEQNYTAPIRRTYPPRPELFDLSLNEEPGEARPDRLYEVWPREKVQRHTVDQIVEAVPVPVPLVVEQLVDVLSLFDFQVPEQVVEVTKIIIEDIPSLVSRIAVGGTAGGSADDSLLPQPDR